MDGLMRSVRAQLATERRRAYRRALERRARYLPQSVELALEADREWIVSGEDERAEG